MSFDLWNNTAMAWIYREDVLQQILSGCRLLVLWLPQCESSMTGVVSHYALSARVWVVYMSLCLALTFFSAIDNRLCVCMCAGSHTTPCKFKWLCLSTLYHLVVCGMFVHLCEIATVELA